MDLHVDRSDPLPLAEQVAAEIRRAIAEGEAGPGDRLPLAKDLAAVMGVNKNTVFRALHLLRDEGILEFRRGHGITVSGTPEKSTLVAQVHEDGEEVLALAPRLGVHATVQPYPLERADEALSDLAHDRVTGAAVLHVR